MLIKMEKSLMNLIYVQMMVFCLLELYFHAIVRPLTQMNAYFLEMSSKRCTKMRNI